MYRFILALLTLTLFVPIAPAEEKKEDAAATKLLADARAARAEWVNFPGFEADVVVNLDGKTAKGTVKIGTKGDVTLSLRDADEAEKWAKRQLASLVGHRLSDGGGGSDTPCAFADDVVDHPLGRAINVLNDEFHSSYRIRDRQVIVVNRSTKETRFTITVMENRLNADNKFLPISYVVNTWELKGDALVRSDTHHHTWKRVGAFDLPESLTVVSAMAGKQEARSMTLTNHTLHARIFREMGDGARERFRTGLNPGGVSEPSDRVKRSFRWKINFDKATPKAYLEQLHGMGAILGIPDVKDQEVYHTVRDLEKRPAKVLEEDPMKLGLIPWFNNDPEWTAQLMKELGIDSKAKGFVVFLPIAMEEAFVKVEREFGGLKDKDIEETIFRLERDGDRLVPKVTEQKKKQPK
jgi:hypothetical protein